MPLVETLKWVLDHPLNRGRRTAALKRYALWQIASRTSSGKILVDWVNGSRILVGRGESGLIGNVYCGLLDFEDMGFLLHLLRPEDLFVDVGANAGAYTVLSGAAGARGMAIEPVPDTFQRLLDNVALNRLGTRTTCLNIALGDRDGILRISTDEDVTDHALADWERCDNALPVPVHRLDDVMAEHNPVLIKIDVEGYEEPVLKGAEKTMASPFLLAVILELNGSGKRYGFDDEDIHRSMLNRGFSTHRYDPCTRTMIPLNGGKNTTGYNTLYVADNRLKEVDSRLKGAPPFSVLHQTF
jgi:FkbM family methyltransferase